MARDSAPLVAIRGLGKHYVRGDQIIPVLVDINLDVQGRRLRRIDGTVRDPASPQLLNLVAGIDKPSAGRILVAGVRTSRSSTTASSQRGVRRTSASSSSSTT
jgi:ABC-type lipoprotein export system ATPase subunit